MRSCQNSPGFAGTQLKTAIALLLFGMVICSSASARVFDLSKETFAGHLSYNFGMFPSTTAPYSDSSLADAYSDDMLTTHGGEFGFLFGKGPISFLFGLELLAPAKLQDVKASLNGTDVHTIESDFSAYAPKIGVEINFYTQSTWRLFGGGSYGMASATLKNSYSAVTATPPGAHYVMMKSSAVLYSGYAGGEMYMNDSTTVLAMLGHKVVNFSKWTYASDTTTFDGAHSKGDEVLLSDGTSRAFNLTNQFVSIGFRFYLL